jgi:hypothetical protein
LIAEPQEVKVDDSNSKVLSFAAGVVATKVKIVGAYLIR